MISLISILGIVSGLILSIVAVAISRIGKILPCIVFCVGNLLAISGLLRLLKNIGWLSLPFAFYVAYTLAITGFATYYFHRKTYTWHWCKNQPATYVLNYFKPLSIHKYQK
jgi:hypothetical protein